MFLIVNHPVEDFESWKAVFEDIHPKLAVGSTSTRVMRSLDDPSDITIVTEFADRKDAEALVANPELQAGMAKAGIKARPTIRFEELVLAL